MPLQGHPRHLQVRHGTAAAWTAANPVLREGEFGFETDQNKLKCGDGVTVWTSLPYVSGGAGAQGPAGPAGPPGPSLEPDEPEVWLVPGPQGATGPQGPAGSGGGGGGGWAGTIFGGIASTTYQHDPAVEIERLDGGSSGARRLNWVPILGGTA